MEYRCYILGDAIAEPGAVLRRLLFDPFPESEQRALTRRTLLQVRADEAKSATAAPAGGGGGGGSVHATSMAVSVPDLNAPRSGAVTLPNPSMPSVDITVQFGVMTEPRELERVMLGHYAASASGAGGLGRSPRRRATSPGSTSGRDVGGGAGVFSETSSLTHHGAAATGLALRAPPDALVLVFNPFSLASFLRLRVEWAHALRGLRQQRQAQLDYLHTHQQQQQLYQSNSSVVLPRNASTATLMGSPLHVGHGKGHAAGTAAAAAMFAATPTAASPLSPAFPMDAMEGFPPVLLVGARMELMREAMEATPSIRLPSSRDVAEVAQGLQAPVYLEVGTDWDDTVNVLRAAIARGCMGELAAAPAVAFDAAYQARQGTIARAMEEVQANPWEEDEAGDDGTTFSAGANGSLVRPPVISLLGPHGGADGGEAVRSATAAGGEGRDASAGTPQEMPDAGAPLHGAPCESEPAERGQPRPGDAVADDLGVDRHSSRASLRASSRGSSSSSARSDTRSADVAERLESPLRGRELRRHLVHALAPLCLPPARESAPAAKSTWTWRLHPRSGRLFYVVRATGKAQYARPADYDGPPPPAVLPPDASAEQSATLPPSPAAAARDLRNASESGSGEAAAPSRSLAAAAATENRRRIDGECSPSSALSAPAARHSETHAEDDMAVSVDVATPSSQEGVGAWRRRQQVQLRRARVRQLERQVDQVRAQADRLRAQSEANGELRQRVVALRAELDAAEQSFLAGVAEQNAQLAAEAMQVTQAIEELLAAPHPQLATSASGTALELSRPDVHRHSAVPITCLPPETQRADAEVQEAVAGLQDTLDRRDAQAEAVTQLRGRKARLAQRTQEAEAELAALSARVAKLDSALTALGAQVHASHTEEARLREQLAGCETARAAEERRRVAVLEERVAAQRETETLVLALEAQRNSVAAAQARFESTLRGFHRPTRTKPAVLLEERERLRLALEAATAQCARALLDGADRLDTATRLASDLRGGAAQLQSARARHERRLRDQLEAAERAQARLVLARYTPQSAVPRGDRDDVLTDELAELRVAACTEARGAWQAHDERVTVPLLVRAEGAMRELDAVMHEAQARVGEGRTTSSQLKPLALKWLAEEVTAVGQAVCEASAEPQYALAQLGNCAPSTDHHRVDTHLPDAAQTLPAVPSHFMKGGADTVAQALWRTCDGVLLRMSRLSPQFTSLYTSVRGV